MKRPTNNRDQLADLRENLSMLAAHAEDSLTSLRSTRKNSPTSFGAHSLMDALLVSVSHQTGALCQLLSWLEIENSGLGQRTEIVPSPLVQTSFSELEESEIVIELTEDGWEQLQLLSGEKPDIV